MSLASYPLSLGLQVLSTLLLSSCAKGILTSNFLDGYSFWPVYYLFPLRWRCQFTTKTGRTPGMQLLTAPFSLPGSKILPLAACELWLLLSIISRQVILVRLICAFIFASNNGLHVYEGDIMDIWRESHGDTINLRILFENRVRPTLFFSYILSQKVPRCSQRSRSISRYYIKIELSAVSPNSHVRQAILATQFDVFEKGACFPH